MSLHGSVVELQATLFAEEPISIFFRDREQDTPHSSSEADGDGGDPSTDITTDLTPAFIAFRASVLDDISFRWR